MKLLVQRLKTVTLTVEISGFALGDIMNRASRIAWILFLVGALAATAGGMCAVIRRADELSTAAADAGSGEPHPDSIATWG